MSFIMTHQQQVCTKLFATFPTKDFTNTVLLAHPG